jgi:hypothetical protein
VVHDPRDPCDRVQEEKTKRRTLEAILSPMHQSRDNHRITHRKGVDDTLGPGSGISRNQTRGCRKSMLVRCILL